MLSPEPDEPGPTRFALDPDPLMGVACPTPPGPPADVESSCSLIVGFSFAVTYIKLERNRTPLRDKARRRRPSALWCSWQARLSRTLNTAPISRRLNSPV